MEASVERRQVAGQRHLGILEALPHSGRCYLGQCVFLFASGRAGRFRAAPCGADIPPVPTATTIAASTSTTRITLPGDMWCGCGGAAGFPRPGFGLHPAALPGRSSFFDSDHQVLFIVHSAPDPVLTQCQDVLDLTVLRAIPVQSASSLIHRRLPTKEAIDDRHKKQGAERGEDQPADHRPSQRRVLFAAFAEPERHGQHSDDHGQRGHQHRTDARKARR